MSEATRTAYVAIGGNLGDVRATFSGASTALGEGGAVRVTRRSPLYRTAPVGGPEGQPAFLNAALEVATRLSPHNLLRRLLAVEARFARERTVHWGPRTLDLDLLLYGPEATVDDPPELVVPHPRMTERAFVLVPLAALVPNLVAPTFGRTLADLRDRLRPAELAGVERVADTWS